MPTTICELKIALKAKGIKGITGLNKAELEALLKGGKSEPKKEVEKSKVFTPAPTKGATPVVAEKQIDKKIKPPKMLMLTYKEPGESKKETKPPVKLKRPKQTEDERITMLNTKRDGTNCQKLMKKAGLKNKEDLRKYIIANHPDKMKNYDPNSAAANLYRELSNCSSVFKNIKGYLEEGLLKGFKGLI